MSEVPKYGGSIGMVCNEDSRLGLCESAAQLDWTVKVPLEDKVP